jgi:hypothetical protein
MFTTLSICENRSVSESDNSGAGGGDLQLRPDGERFARAALPDTIGADLGAPQCDLRTRLDRRRLQAHHPANAFSTLDGDGGGLCPVFVDNSQHCLARPRLGRIRGQCGRRSVHIPAQR